MKFATLIFSLVLLSAKLCEAVQTWKSYPRKAWDFELVGNYYQTTANYLSEGFVFETLPNGSSYRLFTSDFNVRYHLSSPWAFFVDSQIGYAESRSRTEQRSNSTLNYIRLGTDFTLSQGRVSWIPEFTFLYPLRKNSLSGDEVATSQGAMEVGARMIAQARFSLFRTAFYGGFNYRNEGVGSQIPYGGLLEMQVRKFVLGNELKGYRTVGLNLSSSEDTERNQWASRVNGGSRKFASANPSLLENVTWIRWVLGPSFYMQMQGAFSVTGSNTAAGWSLGASLLYRFRPDLPSVSQKSEKFQNDFKDGVDQELFERTSQPE